MPPSPLAKAYITTERRQQLASDLARNLAANWRSGYAEIAAQRGVATTRTLPPDAAQAIARFAAQRAKYVQDGINSRIDKALSDLGPNPTAAARRRALRAVQTGAEAHHEQTLVPFLRSWGIHQGRMDAANTTPGDINQDWTWEQFSDCEDECQEAASLGPSPLSSILAVTGGPPPVHENCACDLSPAEE